MAERALNIVLRLRRQSLDDTRATLMAREADEQVAIGRERVARQAIHDEMAAATRLNAEDAAVEAFAAWLPRGRATVDDASTLLERAQSEVMRARTELNLMRAAVEVVEKLIEKRDAESAMEVLRKQQIVLDEIKPRRRRFF